MKPRNLTRARLGAFLLLGLCGLPAAIAGSFTATTLVELQLVSPAPAGVTLTWRNDLSLDQGNASDPALAFYDNDSLLEADGDTGLSTTLVSIGEAEAPRGQSAEANANLWSDAAVVIENTSNDEVTLEFQYMVNLLAAVVARPFGASTATAFARVELWWDMQNLVDELVAAALDGVATDDFTTSGGFEVAVPAGVTRTIRLLADAGGTASHVPVPASLPLVAAGLLLVGLVRRRRAG